MTTFARQPVSARTTHVGVERDHPPIASDRDLARARAVLSDAMRSLDAKLRTDRAEGCPAGSLHWCAELEGDSILSSEYLLMKLILGQENDRGSPEPRTRPDGSIEPGGYRVGRGTLERIVNHLRLTQRPDGSWGQYPGSGPDISACVKAYLALKCFGDLPDMPHMRRARERILALGGAEKCNTFSTFYLACLGQVEWNACPSIPPEIIDLPRWFPFHLDKVAAWTRTMIVPLAICSALRPVRVLPREWHIDELFVDQRSRTRLNQAWDNDEPLAWKNVFLAADRLLKIVQRRGLSPLRRGAIKRCEAWIVDRVRPETTEGLGAIFPPMVYLQIAFKALGYTRDHPLIQKAERDLDDFIIDEPNHDPRLDHVRLQPCFSPIWDTGIALYAMTEAGQTAANNPRLASVCDWLRARQVRMTGDWVRNLRDEDRGIRLGHDAAAWAFEYKNEWYPDVDDTAMVAKALFRAGDRPGQTAGGNRETAAKAARWIIAMQNDDGGWAAFDKTTDRPWMEAVPFADHNAMQDPSCADITGRVIESLVTCGVVPSHPSIVRAVQYLLSKQEPEGCWWGRWGCNYLYGTWQALGGMSYAGIAPSHPSMQRAVAWVKSVQNVDGGFGESANSYLDRSLMGQGPSTASQTAWGLLCLLYCCPTSDPAVQQAANWLCDHQLEQDKPPFEPARCTGVETVDEGSSEYAATDFLSDSAGGWSEHYFTGTGFPKVFYLRYNLYRHYFPVMVLARFVALADVARPSNRSH
jgi:squalene-hopene/tetraprenyl-beta-curcumene cyclase